MILLLLQKKNHASGASSGCTSTRRRRRRLIIQLNSKYYMKKRNSFSLMMITQKVLFVMLMLSSISSSQKSFFFGDAFVLEQATTTLRRRPSIMSRVYPSLCYMSLLDDMLVPRDDDDNNKDNDNHNIKDDDEVLQFTTQLIASIKDEKKNNNNRSNNNNKHNKQFSDYKKKHIMIQNVKRKIQQQHPDALKDAEDMVRKIVSMEREEQEEEESKLAVRTSTTTTQQQYPTEVVSETLRAYNMWIHAIARCSPKHNIIAPDKKVELVLDEMIKSGIQPNAVTYTSIIDVYAKSGTPEKMETILEKLLLGDYDATTHNNNNNISTSISVDTILNAWAQQGTMASAEQAEAILTRLETVQSFQDLNNNYKPTTNSYATVIKAWGNAGTKGSAERAEMLLQRLLSKYKQEATLNGPPGALSSSNLEPNVSIFNKVIIAWSNSKCPEAGKRGWKLIEQMKKLALLEESSPPNGITYNTYPDIISYNSVISAISHNTNDKNAAPKTERIVQDMQKAVVDANKKKQSKEEKEGKNNKSFIPPSPNTVTFNNILYAWSKSTLPGAAIRANKVLKYMLNSGRDEIMPDSISFNSVLDAWAKSKEPHKALKARQLLDEMLMLYKKKTNNNPHNIKPTSPIPFNTVLNACAFSAIGTTDKEQREALQIAVNTYTNMKQDSNGLAYPDTVTYGNMIKCFANLMPRGQHRSKMSLKVFQKCCQEGMVGPLVWNEIKRAVPYKVLEDVLKLSIPVTQIEMKDLPRKWKTRNRFDKLQQQSKKKQRSTINDDDNNKKKAPTKQVRRAFIVETSVQSGKDM